MAAERPVLLLAGGTGGHIFPALAVAAELDRMGVPVSWLGSRAGMESELVPARGVEFHGIDIAGLRGKGWSRLLSAPMLLLRALWQARRVVRSLQPRCVLSFGGYAAGPGGVAAWLSGVPLLVHEQNRAPGMTNRILARFARLILCGFPDAFAASPKLRVLGNPVRADIAALPAPDARARDATVLPRLLVLGGSQGAMRLNELVPQAIAALGPGRVSVHHQCGRRHLEAARAAYAAHGVDAQVDAFIEDMASAYAAADLVLARSGALTLAEICAAGLPSLLVPFPYAVDDHQTRNAEWLVQSGAALLLPEAALDADSLRQALDSLLSDSERRLSMARAARALSLPDAAAQVAALCANGAGS